MSKNEIEGEASGCSAPDFSRLFRERVGSKDGVEQGRDRAVSGPPKGVGRSRTGSGNGCREIETLKPLAQTVASLEASGSEESVFGTAGSNSSMASLDNQVGDYNNKER